MSDNGQLFPYEKAIVLNAIYDALDALSFTIDYSNSVRGTLSVSSATFPKMKGRIAISPTLSGEQTQVEVFTNDEDHEASKWIPALMDEVQALLRRAERREKE